MIRKMGNIFRNMSRVAGALLILFAVIPFLLAGEIEAQGLSTENHLSH